MPDVNLKSWPLLLCMLDVRVECYASLSYDLISVKFCCVCEMATNSKRTNRKYCCQGTAYFKCPENPQLYIHVDTNTQKMCCKMWLEKGTLQYPSICYFVLFNFLTDNFKKQEQGLLTYSNRQMKTFRLVAMMWSEINISLNNCI